LGLIVEKLSKKCFLAALSNIVEDLVDGDQEDVNTHAVIGTVVDDLVNGNQEDASKLSKCNNGNVVTSITVTFDDKKLDQEEAIKMGKNNDAEDLMRSDSSNLPLAFSGVTFFSIKDFPFLGVAFIVFLRAFSIMILFFMGVCMSKSERTSRWHI
jgi:hypothetical protein